MGLIVSMTITRLVASVLCQLISSPMRTGTHSPSPMILLSSECQHLLNSLISSSPSVCQPTLMLLMTLLVSESLLPAGDVHLTLLVVSLKFFVRLMLQQSLLLTARPTTALSKREFCALILKVVMVHAMVTLVAQ